MASRAARKSRSSKTRSSKAARAGKTAKTKKKASPAARGKRRTIARKRGPTRAPAAPETTPREIPTEALAGLETKVEPAEPPAE